VSDSAVSLSAITLICLAEQGTRNTSVSGIPVQQFTLTVSTTPSVSFELDLSDFGNFSMATRMRTVLQSTTTTFQMRDIQLR
jgi:hypothetical protein